MSYFIDLVIVGLSLGMVYALVAIGISLIYSGLDVVHFAHGEIYMLGAFIGLVIYDTLKLPLPARAGRLDDPDRTRRRGHRARVLPPNIAGRRRVHGRRDGDGDLRLRHVDRAAERRVPDLGREGGAVPGELRHADRDRQRHAARRVRVDRRGRAGADDRPASFPQEDAARPRGARGRRQQGDRVPDGHQRRR